ncbi:MULTISPECIES: helix-hairpin-helix domain-containing protein [Nostoc]|uniref:Helix-hairpin-helix domain-containing protein n=1 Tax=Nostoc paludosum FACHB-159 TaxID=2692908 RepID=A0ABR8K2V0_9NOSO|nr:MULTISPECIES: helix-hairpin-helix domain-containing protein [Nostoc]MBD2677709.1 helix-hairpin-helix domain-containing protein [Nostoc sp. FACHB-857]MBD2733757.1 helix-hairpin-helix domain-containing protein [Nostoc paludosum FACHB-159]
MNNAERRDRIVEYLRIKSISHGQVYTFQIAIPESEVLEISSEKCEYLKNSLIQQGTNLIPLIVRRTEAYSEEEEYEVVYGADWCFVAKELDIEKLWVWVFDMTDEQVVAAKEEMQQLLGFSDSIPVVLPSVSEDTESTQTIVEQLDKIFRQSAATLNQKIEQVAISVKKIESYNNYERDIYKKIEILTQKVEILTHKVEQPTTYIRKNEEAESKQAITQNETESITKQLEQVTQSVTKIENFINKLFEVDAARLITKDNKINVNTIKTAQELERYKIPQIGSKRAEAIFRLRERKGKFESLTELMEVKGITQGMVKILDAYLFCE